jgi:hypothetical protein
VKSLRFKFGKQVRTLLHAACHSIQYYTCSVLLHRKCRTSRLKKRGNTRRSPVAGVRKRALSVYCRIYAMVSNITSMLVILLLSVSIIDCLSLSTRSPMLRSISCRRNMLDATISSSSHSRSIMRVATALQHSTGNNDDKPYLQHVCPSCSYVYDESKGFKKRHPPGKIYAFS